MRILKVTSVFMLAILLAINLAACGSNNNADKSDSTDKITGEGSESIDSTDGSSSENTDSSDSQDEIPSTVLEDAELGVRLELYENYADCESTPMETSEIEGLIPEALGGFNIIKTISGESIVLSNVMVIPNTVIEDPVIRGGYPYIQSGKLYSVVASLRQISSANIDNETANALRNGMLNQLTSLEFDESVVLEMNN